MTRCDKAGSNPVGRRLLFGQGAFFQTQGANNLRVFGGQGDRPGNQENGNPLCIIGGAAYGTDENILVNQLVVDF